MTTVSASQRRAADSTSVLSTVCRSKVERLVTLSTSAVAVCCCSDSRSSLSSREVALVRPSSRQDRNRSAFHMIGDHVISMPDKWEYPWFAAWDLAFHTIALSTVDTNFAKEQLDLLLRQ